MPLSFLVLSYLHLISIINGKDLIWSDSMNTDRNWELSVDADIDYIVNNISCASGAGITIQNLPFTSKYNVSFYVKESNTLCPDDGTETALLYNKQIQKWVEPTSRNGDRYTFDCILQPNISNCEYTLPISIRLLRFKDSNDGMTLFHIIQNLNGSISFPSTCQICNDQPQICNITSQYLCTQIGVESYITRWHSTKKYRNIYIEYHSDGPCQLLYSVDIDGDFKKLNIDSDNGNHSVNLPNTTNNIQNLGIRFKNKGKNNETLCFIDQVYLFGEIDNDTKIEINNNDNNNKDEEFISTEMIGGVAGGAIICICCCLFIFCWWRFKQMGYDEENKPNTPESSIGSSKFRRLFGLDESKRKDTLQPDATPERAITSPYDFAARERQNPHKNTSAKATKSKSSPMPKIGNVTPANAMRALKIGNRTPGGPDEVSRSSNIGMPKLSLQPQNSDKSIKSSRSNRTNQSIDHKSDRDRDRDKSRRRSYRSSKSSFSANSNISNITPGMNVTGSSMQLPSNINININMNGGSMRSVYSKSADSGDSADTADTARKEQRPTPSGSDKLGIMNSINVKIRNKKKSFEKVRTEGKKDVVIVERGFQHKNTHTYTTPNDQNHDTDFGGDDTSESRTPVLVSDIIGTHQ